MQSRLLHLVFSISLAFVSFYTLADKGAVRVNDTNWPPYLFSPVQYIGQQTFSGLAKDVINYCFAKQNQVAKYVPLPVKRTHLYMQNGQLDMAIYSYKKEREQFVLYGKEPLFISSYGFAVRADSAIEIDELSDLTQYRFGHLAGLAHTPHLSELITTMRAEQRVVNGYSLKALFGQLLAKPNRIDILANSKETILWRAKELGLDNKIKVLDYVVTQKPYFITLSKKSSRVKSPYEFLTKMDNCLKDIKQNNIYNEFLNTYGL